VSRIDELNRQAARAERLAREIFDPQTVERLKQAAREYRAEAERLAAAGAPPQGGTFSPTSPRPFSEWPAA
jgi:hypothetical protein